MAEYIPAIQERFRRNGYPIERSGKVQQVTIMPAGVQATQQARWEYRTKQETQSILVQEDSVVLQSTSYERFEDFAKELSAAVETVLSETEHSSLGVIQRVGLRYVDVVKPDPGRDYRFYLRPGLHGVTDDVFRSKSHRLHVENVGKTEMGGTMIIRIVQNDQGGDLPPDLAAGAPKHEPQAEAGKLCTLVDMDHFVEGNFDPDTEWVIDTAYKLHDDLVETFHNHVVTPEAVEAWK
jgi:uncharacterized protein (TIGR04255 family)